MDRPGGRRAAALAVVLILLAGLTWVGARALGADRSTVPLGDVVVVHAPAAPTGPSATASPPPPTPDPTPTTPRPVPPQPPHDDDWDDDDYDDDDDDD